MLGIRCPTCEEMVFLALADWEDFIGDLPLGQPKRLGLVCLNCNNEFLLQLSLSQVIRE
ncbi:hypothetical protein ES703_67392 [subsurface metagenome]